MCLSNLYLGKWLGEVESSEHYVMICCQSRDACMEIIFTPYITSGCQIPFPSHAAACKCEFGTELHGFVLASSLPEAWLTWHGLEGHSEREREREGEIE